MHIASFLIFFVVLVGVHCESPLAPSQDPFYRSPTEAETELPPGNVLAVRKAPYPFRHPLQELVSAAYQLLYRTTDTFGHPTTAVTTILIPSHPTDKIFTYVAAILAPSVDCSQSYVLAEGVQSHKLDTMLEQNHLATLAGALNQGWIVTMPDFEGLNAAFMANRRAAYAVMDSIRALLAFAPTLPLPLSPGSPVAIMGYSAASTPAVMTVELQEAYAPELKIAGVAISDLIPDLRKTLHHLLPSSGMFPLVLYGLANEYEYLDPLIQQHLVDDPEKRQAFDNCRHQCFGPTTEYFGAKNTSAFFRVRDFIREPILRPILDQNSLNQTTPTVPLMLYQSTHDNMYPPDQADIFVSEYCAAGATVDYRRALTESHGILSIDYIVPALVWVKDRLDGIPLRGGCTTSTHLSPLTDLHSLAFLGDSVVGFLERIGV